MKKDPDTCNIVKKQKMIISGSVGKYQNTVIDRNTVARFLPMEDHHSSTTETGNFISTSEVLQIELSECKTIYIIFIQICRPALLADALKKSSIPDHNWSII